MKGVVFLDMTPCESSRKNRCFGRTYHLHLQGNGTLESSQLAARTCLTTDGEESLLHGTSTVVFIRYRGVVGGRLLRQMCLD
jgi:hypothetical protein